MHEGLDMGGVMLLLAGNVKATSITASGREQILAFRGPGDVIGELAAVDDRPHSGSEDPAEQQPSLSQRLHRFHPSLVVGRCSSPGGGGEITCSEIIYISSHMLRA